MATKNELAELEALRKENEELKKKIEVFEEKDNLRKEKARARKKTDKYREYRRREYANHPERWKLSLGTRVTAEQKERFDKYCKRNGSTMNAVLTEYIRECIKH